MGFQNRLQKKLSLIVIVLKQTKLFQLIKSGFLALGMIKQKHKRKLKLIEKK